ncbi:glucose-6-phosphate exchanger SLC37A2-like, partial [Hyposmocoma kahamanoa]|uniref:glucose-6-phosphate exchanger SLC37A2-like n=1 Tax=Hyposmocoma kahamanoa TaxID=1477025 RepID=UPI000E6D771C
MVLVLTYITYMTFHLTRKPISVVKSVLHRNCSELPPPVPPYDPKDDQWCNWAPFNTDDANTLLGMLDSAFLFSYAGAMFVSGMVAERVDLRYFLSLGMMVSAVFCYLFGLGYTLGIHSIAYYLLVQAGAGLAQTTGWPGTVTVVSRWFGKAKKGLIFGIWNSHTSLGNILGTLMAAAFVERDWSLSFMYPALVMGIAGCLVWLLLPPEPRVLGLVLPEQQVTAEPASHCRRNAKRIKQRKQQVEINGVEGTAEVQQSKDGVRISMSGMIILRLMLSQPTAFDEMERMFLLTSPTVNWLSSKEGILGNGNSERNCRVSDLTLLSIEEEEE